MSAVNPLRVSCKCSKIKETSTETTNLLHIGGVPGDEFHLDVRDRASLDFNLTEALAREIAERRFPLLRALLEVPQEKYIRGEEAQRELEEATRNELSSWDRAAKRYTSKQCIGNIVLICHYCGTEHLLYPESLTRAWGLRNERKEGTFHFSQRGMSAKIKVKSDPRKDAYDLLLNPDPDASSVWINGVKTGLDEDDLSFAENMMREAFDREI